MKAPIFSRQPALRVLFAVLVLAGGLQAGGLCFSALPASPSSGWEILPQLSSILTQDLWEAWPPGPL